MQIATAKPQALMKKHFGLSSQSQVLPIRFRVYRYIDECTIRWNRVVHETAQCALAVL